VRRETVLSILLCAGVMAVQAQQMPVPDFQLRDVNPHSPRASATVSPRDYRLQISAYYFGAAG